MNFDLVIIGGGPSALSAAYEAGRAGLSILIVEETHMLGGQLNQQTQILNGLPIPFSNQEWRGIDLSLELIHRLNPYDIEYVTGYSFIGVESDGTVGLNNGTDLLTVKTSIIIVASGASEESIAFHGWTLPGVLTIGAAQILINREKVIPGKSAVIIGTTDRACEVANQLHQAGITIYAMIEQGNKQKCTERNNKLLNKLNIPVYLNCTQLKAEGVEEVQKFSFQTENDGDVSFETELICVEGGLSPIIEANSLLDFKLTFVETLGKWIPVYNSNFQTSSPNIFVAGNVTGISTQGAALITGSIAGISAAEAIAKVTKEDALAKRHLLWNELQQIEMEYNPSIFSARLNHIQRFETFVSEMTV